MAGSTGARPLGGEAWAEQTVAEIGKSAFRDSPLAEADLPSTSWAVAQLTPEALTRLSFFLDDLVKRAPMASPVWMGHRQVLESFADDLRRVADDALIEDIRARAAS